MKIIFSLLENNTDQRPQRARTTWSSFVKDFRKPSPRDVSREEYLALPRQKQAVIKNGPAWVPGEFKPGGKRCDADLQKLYCFVGDIDNKPGQPQVSLDQGRQALNGYRHILHTTFGNSPDQLRYRFVVPFERPVTPAKYRRIFDHFNGKFGGALDPKGKTPSQPYYLPSCPRDAVKDFKYLTADGEPFDPDTLRVQEDAPDHHVRVTLPRNLPHVEIDDLPVSKRIKALIRAGNDSRYASRSEALYAVVNGLVDAGCDDATIASVCLDPANVISKKPREARDNGRQYITREIAKARSKLTKQTLRGSVLMRCVADIETRPIDWMWYGRLARGKVIIVAGHPGTGKSQLGLSCAATVSTGGRWPDRSPCKHGSVIILSAEDDPADTTGPRLVAAGADLRNVHVIDAVRVTGKDGRPCETQFDLGRDIAALDSALGKMPDAALLIIDPITAYLGSADSHKNAEVRGLLAPLSKLAEKHNIAILCITHLNKGGGAGVGTGALMRVMGSLAFVAAARAAYVVVRDPEDHGRRLFLPAKNNLGTDETGFAFRIQSCKVSDDIETSRVVWESGAIEASVDEMLDAPSEPKKRDAAIEFLKDLLREKPVRSAEVARLAEMAGLAWKTVMRAKDRLGVRAIKERTADGSWSWAMPNYQTASIEDGQTRLVNKNGHLGHVDHLRNKSKLPKKVKKDSRLLKDHVRRVKVKFPPSRRVRKT